MTEKSFDPFDHCDDDWTMAVVEVAEEMERDSVTSLAEVRQERKASR